MPKKYFNPKARFDTFTMIPDLVMKSGSLSDGEKIVYARLMRYFHEDDGYAHVRLSTLAVAVAKSESMTKRILRSLREKNLVHVERETAVAINRYRFPWPDAVLGVDPKKSSDEIENSPEIPENEGVHICTLAGCISAPSQGADPPPLKDTIDQIEPVKKQPFPSGKGTEAPAPASPSPTPSPKTYAATPSSANTWDVPSEENEENDLSEENKFKGLPEQQTFKGQVVGLNEYAQKAKAKTDREVAKLYNKRRSNENTLRNLKGNGAGNNPLMKELLSWLWDIWQEELKEFDSELEIVRWGGKERGQIGELVKKYNGGKIEIALRYVVRNWKAIADRMLKGKGGVAPTIGFLLRFHDSLFPEALKWWKYVEVLDKHKRWREENPDAISAPAGLVAEVKGAREALASMGL